jgi:hypothetical protein
MKMTVTDRRPCKMQRGDLRRVPQNASAMAIAYHVGCPRCGFVTPAIRGDKGLRIDEGPEGVTFSLAIRCLQCLVDIAIAASTATLHEGPDVRAIR